MDQTNNYINISDADQCNVRSDYDVCVIVWQYWKF